MRAPSATKSPRWCNICAAISLGVMVLGILAATVGHDLVQQALFDGLAEHYTLTSPSAADYGPWATSSDPNAAVIYTAFYVYNINNPYEFSQGAPLNVTEVGPLTYYFR